MPPNRPLSLATALSMAALSLWLLPVAAEAQRGPGPGGQAPYSRGGGRNVAGQFDYYALVMSWSPSYCATQPQGSSDPQCSRRRDGKRYAFVLHGLWPQHERGWPESCLTRERPFVPDRTITAMLDIMPSKRLVIHEYKKHGTCAGLGVDAYFDLSRKLFHRIKVPARYAGLNRPLLVARQELVTDFIAANPGLRPTSIGVACGGPGNRLRELRFCFDKKGALRNCGRNEEQRRLCSADRVSMPPIR